MKHEISNKELTIEAVVEIAENRKELHLSSESREQIVKCRKYLEEKVKSGEAFYGINTGFGSLCNIQIPTDDLNKLQHNLVVSHACGMGDRIHDDIVRLMLILKIQSLSYGHSGVREKVVDFLISMFNHDILPEVFKFGSLGASGDLAPLAHLSLPILGLGNVSYKGKTVSAAQALKDSGLEPFELSSKEGLALLNGTQFMSAFGCLLVHAAKKLLDKMTRISAISVDASFSHLQPFDPLIHKIRKQKGQEEIASQIRELLKDSEIAAIEKDQVQDPYSMRCIPQVHGAVHDTLEHVERIFTDEINSVTDNPNIFPDEDKILSGGNFHGQPLAMALDYLSIALAELGSIAERRTYFLLSGGRNLPVFLTQDAGLNSGLMIAQYTAASLASRNKQLTMPASTDSFESSNGQEDHVSMGANAATKCYEIFENVEHIAAIELMTSIQAISFRRPLKTSSTLEETISQFRERVPFVAEDRLMHDELSKSLTFFKEM